jgi:hypothetical protein
MKKALKSELRSPVPSGVGKSVLGMKRFAAISAVEGLKLSAKGRARVLAPQSSQRRRTEIIRAYLDPKGDR